CFSWKASRTFRKRRCAPGCAGTGRPSRSTSTRWPRSRSGSTSVRISVTPRCASTRWASAAPPTPRPATPSWRSCAWRCAKRCAPWRAGALGFATGRTPMHRTPAWDPVPGTFADRRELDALAGALAEEGTGVFELVPYGAAGEDAGGTVKEFDWLTPLARDTNRPFSLGVAPNLGYPDVWPGVLRLTEAAAGRGAHTAPQVAVRAVAILMGFDIAINPLSIYPAAADLVSMSRADVMAQLRDRSLRARLLDSVQDHSGVILGGMA